MMTCTIVNVIYAILVKLPIANGLVIKSSFPLTKTFDVLALSHMLHLNSLLINQGKVTNQSAFISHVRPFLIWLSIHN